MCRCGCDCVCVIGRCVCVCGRQYVGGAALIAAVMYAWGGKG